MSKTTIALLFFLLLITGALLYVQFGLRPDSVIASFPHVPVTSLTTPDTSLSLSSEKQSVQTGQTITVAVLIHNPNPHPGLVQIELAYNPQIVTIDSVNPGTFFTRPVIAFHRIDPNSGRISYTLRCPTDPAKRILQDCTNPTLPTVATITLTVNPYLQKNTTSLTFFPKTAIRSLTGRDMLKKTTGIQLKISSSFYQPYPIASYSATASQSAK